MAEQDIELVLPEGEVDIHEADVIQEKLEDRDLSAASPEGEVEGTPPEELDDYSDKVKKRIDKLTYQMREAERQRDEAVDYAQKIQDQNGSLQQKLRSSDSTLVNEYEARVNSDTERARKALKEAQELGDAEAIALATEAVAKTSVEAQNVQRLQAQQKTNVRRPLRRPRLQQSAPTPEAAPPDPRAEDWAEKNSWFGTDRGMTFAAFGVHQELLNDNVDPSSNDYYRKIDERMREYFPQKFDEPKNVQQVAGSSRGAGTTKPGSRKVKLSPSQVAIAKRLGVPLEDYAKYAS
jgi:hypothetical protein|tara:strand:- start:644 stop:1522 length:879 start_codon:yes stop_codon:yes gene_type:complete